MIYFQSAEGETTKSAEAGGSLRALYAILLPYLSHKEPEIRRLAFEALRFVNTREARLALATALQDQDGEIRETASLSLGDTPGDENTINTYENVLFKETNETVLKNVLSNLASMRKDYPKAQVLINQFIAQCGKPSICSFANGFQTATPVP